MAKPRHSGPIPETWRAARAWIRHRPKFWPVLRFLVRSRRIEGERFHVWCSGSIPETFDVDRLCRLWEAAEDELGAWFGFTLKKPVVLILCASKAELGSLFGEESRGGAYHRLNAIALCLGGDTSDAEDPETIRHELVHLFSAQWSPKGPPFKSEGLAGWLQGVQGTYRGKPIDFQALVRVVGDGCPPLSRLLDKDVWKSRESYGYAIAGSFTGFLISEYGRDRYRRFYAKAGEVNFERMMAEVFGRDLLTLERLSLTELLRKRPGFEPGISREIADRRAEQAYKRWELHRCIEEVESSVRHGYASARSLWDAGWSCRILGDYAKAAYFFQGALAAWTEESVLPKAKLWLALGQCEDLQGQREAAIQSYRQVLEDAPAAADDEGSSRKSVEEYLRRPYTVSEWFDDIRSWERD